ncbi:MAG TPA: diguanylate cyclase [Bryobacteraceae bacterium]|nr:diguanylate cyclase [Bryobacteraceae bacterium]
MDPVHEVAGEEATALMGAAAPTGVKPIKILAAEDNPVFQSMLRTMLVKWGYDVTMVRDGTEAWRALENENAPRLAILDWMMPGMDGPEVCRRVRAAGREPYTYILLLTARTELRDLVEGIDAGADDYLTKPFNSHELRARLRAGRRILNLQEELLRTREALREQATHDSLTGLLNRASVLEALNNELARAWREALPVSLLMVDLDRFKQINDTHGHQAGDAVLREATRRMRSVTRRYDAVGRYGGEEFLVVLPACDGGAARVQAERVREAVASGPHDAGGVSLNVTCSIGVSGRSRPSLSDADALVRESDAALYRAKSLGRNCVEVYAAAETHESRIPDLPELALAIRSEA